MTTIFYPIETLPNKLQCGYNKPNSYNNSKQRQMHWLEKFDFLGLLVEYIGAVLWCEITYRILITKQREFADLL